MATHSSILAWRIPMDRGAWQATVHRVARVGHGLAIKPPTGLWGWTHGVLERSAPVSFVYEHHSDHRCHIPLPLAAPLLAGQLLPRISCLIAERRNALSALYGPNQPRAGRQPLPLWGLAVSNGGVWSARNEGVEFLCPPGAHTCQAPLSDIHRALCSPPALDRKSVV